MRQHIMILVTHAETDLFAGVVKKQDVVNLPGFDKKYTDPLEALGDGWRLMAPPTYQNRVVKLEVGRCLMPTTEERAQEYTWWFERDGL